LTTALAVPDISLGCSKIWNGSFDPWPRPY